MKISLILAHPDTSSFNHAIARAVLTVLEQNGHTVLFHDLYAEHFDPLLPAEEIPKEAALPPDIDRHCREISQADGIIIVHPNWWGQPPAVLKGWIDRIIRPGIAYEFLEGDDGEGIPHGLLQAETALVFNTSNTETTRERNVFGDPLETLWKNCIFDLCGVENYSRRMFNIVVTSTVEQRREWLEETRRTIRSFFPGNDQQEVSVTPSRPGEITIRETRQIPRDQLLALYRLNQWSSAEKPDLLYKALLNSHTLVSAWIDDRLVGIANAISDGHLVVYYPHMLVHPDHQGNGIGNKMMAALQNKYRSFHQQMLTADKQAVNFYRKCGFERAGETQPMWIYAGDDH
ncbi:GNAT family N-acetyltransferase [Thermodesulfobacteriota bacterium]